MVLPPERAGYFDAFRVESAHNVAANTGLPALVAYVVAVPGSLFLIAQVASLTGDRVVRLGLLSILAALVGHLATDLFMTVELTGSALLWVLIGAGLAQLGPVPRVPTSGCDTLTEPR